MNAPPAPLSLWRERYETLRCHVVENRQLLTADPFGVVLLLRQGLAGWMRAWRTCAEATPQSSTPCPGPWIPSTFSVGSEELTRLIADMTVPHLHPQ